MLKNILLLVVILFPTYSYATPDIGFDLLGLAHYSNLPTRSPKSIGCLDSTFGDPIPNIIKLSSRGSLDNIRVHLLDGSCLRLHNCAKGDPLYGYTTASFERMLFKKHSRISRQLITRLSRYKELAGLYPNVHFFISPILEHNLSKKAWRILANQVKNVFPEVRLVNNALNPKNAERYRGAWIEDHGYKGNRTSEISSLDGATEGNMRDWIQSCARKKLCFYWTERFNCKDSDRWIAPKKRTSCPTKKYLDQKLEKISIN